MEIRKLEALVSRKAVSMSWLARWVELSSSNNITIRPTQGNYGRQIIGIARELTKIGLLPWVYLAGDPYPFPENGHDDSDYSLNCIREEMKLPTKNFDNSPFFSEFWFPLSLASMWNDGDMNVHFGSHPRPLSELMVESWDCGCAVVVTMDVARMGGCSSGCVVDAAVMRVGKDSVFVSHDQQSDFVDTFRENGCYVDDMERVISSTLLAFGCSKLRAKEKVNDK
jgi:hypothetical protein